VKIVLANKSKIGSVDFENLEFGKIFTDHLFFCKYSNNAWGEGKIMPYDDFLVSPSARVFHYGQAIFEGMKCFRSDNDSLILFRPEENFKRFNKSSSRMAIPEISENIFFDGLTELLKIDKDWVKKGDGNALYLRPFVFASEASINASEANEYTFMIICCPAKSYYGNQKIKVKIEEKYSRAAKGGVGYAKAAGNYAAQFYPTSIAIEEGYQQIIWTDSNNHKSIEEAGTMNLFFRIGNKLITSPTSDSILDGITRKSIIELAKNENIDVEERIITVDELLESSKAGELREIFGTGTAVVVLPIKAFGYQNKDYDLPEIDDSWSSMLKKKLMNIQYDKSSEYDKWKLKIN
jgi:branched-chain amino acid aminotransferase